MTVRTLEQARALFMDTRPGFLARCVFDNLQAGLRSTGAPWERKAVSAQIRDLLREAGADVPDDAEFEP